MYDGRLLKLYNMSDDFEFLSVSNRIHQQKKEKKNLSISALIALEIPPSFICCCLHDMLLLVSRFMRSLLPTPQRNSFIPALLMTFVKKSMNLIRFPQISSSTFILFTNSNHGMAIIFIFLKCFFFLQNCLSLVHQYGIEIRYPVFVSCVAQKKCISRPCISRPYFIFLSSISSLFLDLVRQLCSLRVCGIIMITFCTKALRIFGAGYQNSIRRIIKMVS